jgi:DNA-binding response OmpR family regulator
MRYGRRIAIDLTASPILGAGTYLRKPYTLENLGSAVKAELQRT